MVNSEMLYNEDELNQVCQERIRNLFNEIELSLFNITLDCVDEQFYLYLSTNPELSYRKWQALKDKWG